MHGSTDHPVAGRRNGKASAIRVSCPGVERIAWIRVVLVDGRAATYLVHGTRHRRPVVVSVPYATAWALIEAGVPAVIREKVVA